MSNCFGKLALLGVLPVVSLVGCSQGPSRITPPKLDPGATAEAAMSLYDSNGDGVIDEQELSVAGSLRSAMKKLDRDGDGSVTQQEIEQRITSWIDSRLGITTVVCRVTLDGRPLSGATVNFDPEPFVADAVKPATAMTDEEGMARMAMAVEDRPHPNVMGAQVGLYRIRISKQKGGKETIPAKYNVSTELGAEVASDAQGMSGAIRINLTSR